MNDASGKSTRPSFLKTYGHWILGGASAVVLLISVIQYNALVSSEEGIMASQKSLENTIAAGYQNIEAQGMASDKAFTLYIQAIEAASRVRYGNEGLKAAITLIQEDQGGLDMKVLSALQNAITATFNGIESVQRAKIDKVRVYRTKLRSFPSSMYAALFGFPTIDMDAAEKVLSSDVAKRALETGQLPKPKM